VGLVVELRSACRSDEDAADAGVLGLATGVRDNEPITERREV